MIALVAVSILAQADAPPDVAGTWADPARTVFLTPGARSILSGFSPASLDGLQPAASATRFDGVLLRLPAHGFFGPSPLPAQWLEGVHVASAAESSEVGRSLGRSVSLLRAPVRGAQLHGTARLDVSSVSVTAGGVLDATGTEVQAGGRFFALPAIAASLLKIRALLGDWHLRAVQPIGAGDLRLLALGAADDVALTVSGIPVSARLFSQLVDLRWQRDALELGLTGSHDSVALAIRGTQTRHDVVGGEQAVTARAAVRPMVTREVQLAVGGDVSVRRVVLNRASDSALPAVQGTDAAFVAAGSRRVLGTAVLGGVFLEARDAVGPFRWSAGLRGDLWKPVTGAAFGALDPRVSVERVFAEAWTVFGSAGLRHQTATWLVPVPVLDTASWQFGLQQAVVGDLGVRFRPNRAHHFEARGFGSSLRRTIELSPFDDTFLQQVNGSSEDVSRRTGSGWAGGGALSWDFTPTSELWLRVSYSLLTSRRTTTVARYGIDGLPRGEASVEVPWTFDQTHLLQAASTWRLGHGWALGASVTLQSGAPLVGGLYGQDQRPGTDPIRGSIRWVPIDRDLVGRASPWLRVDGRGSKTWRPGALELELFLDVQNLSVWAQPTGQSFGTAPATLAEQSRGDLMLTSKPASSPLGFPIPLLGLEARL